MKLAASAAFVAALAAASAAHAVISPFGGPKVGTDPLGHSWEASNNFGAPGWGEPGIGMGTIVFNPGAISSHFGTWADRLSFIFLEGVGGNIKPADTIFYDVTTGETWSSQYVGGNKVVFTAAPGSQISAGDEFFVNVAFTGPVDTNSFSFAGLWTDDAGGGVPEPATWALMLTGFGLAGVALRRRKLSAVAA